MKWLSAALLSLTAVASLAQGSGLLNLTGSSPEFLPVDRAFVPSVVASTPEEIKLNFAIAEGYYLYREKFKFSLSPEGVALLGTPRLPPGEVEEDPYIGATEIYRRNLELVLPLQAVEGAGADGLVLAVEYQGCADAGLCYAPETRRFELAMAGQPSNSSSAAAASAGASPGSEGSAVKGSVAWLLLGAFATGLALSLTPCVLPMVPIVTAVVVGEGAAPRRGLLLSIAYVAGTATTYTFAGALAGATGAQLQAYFQTPWAIGLLSLLLVLMAAGMFGVLNLRLPGGLQGRLVERLQRFRPRSVGGVYLLGLFSALVVGACVGPLVISVLGIAMERGDPLLGAGLMFAMAWGMGLLLIAVGSGAALLVPRGGAWMTRVSQLLGVVLLAAAIHVLTALPAVPVLLLWGVLLVVCGVYLGATRGLSAEADGWQTLLQGLGLVAIIWGTACLVGGFLGERDPLRPLPLNRLSSVAPTTELPFQRVSTLADLESRLQLAVQQGRPVMLDYYADWCTDCVRMQRSTFLDPRLQAAVAGFTLIQLDVTRNDAASTRLKKRFGVFGPPALVWVDQAGRDRPELTLYGYRTADELLRQAAKMHSDEKEKDV
ncbi:MAG: protein-disulfide reductase DsbD [Gammaproteobacteria bacterium]|nr:protein-disulfide reductase DsbD [Gammaproteobacteria bacterium]